MREDMLTSMEGHTAMLRQAHAAFADFSNLQDMSVQGYESLVNTWKPKVVNFKACARRTQAVLRIDKPKEPRKEVVKKKRKTAKHQSSSSSDDSS